MKIEIRSFPAFVGDFSLHEFWFKENWRHYLSRKLFSLDRFATWSYETIESSYILKFYTFLSSTDMFFITAGTHQPTCSFSKVSEAIRVDEKHLRQSWTSILQRGRKSRVFPTRDFGVKKWAQFETQSRTFKRPASKGETKILAGNNESLIFNCQQWGNSAPLRFRWLASQWEKSSVQVGLVPPSPIREKIIRTNPGLLLLAPRDFLFLPLEMWKRPRSRIGNPFPPHNKARKRYEF